MLLREHSLFFRENDQINVNKITRGFELRFADMSHWSEQFWNYVNAMSWNAAKNIKCCSIFDFMSSWGSFAAFNTCVHLLRLNVAWDALLKTTLMDNSFAIS